MKSRFVVVLIAIIVALVASYRSYFPQGASTRQIISPVTQQNVPDPEKIQRYKSIAARAEETLKKIKETRAKFIGIARLCEGRAHALKEGEISDYLQMGRLYRIGFYALIEWERAENLSEEGAARVAADSKENLRKYEKFGESTNESMLEVFEKGFKSFDSLNEKMLKDAAHMMQAIENPEMEFDRKKAFSE